MHRSTPLNNQRTAGIFLAEGHYTALLRSLRTAHEARWRRMADGCDRHLPGFRRSPATGGSCLWLECPPDIDGRALADRAADLGVLIESGDPFMPEAQAGRFIRLGISYISERRIDPGLERLGRAAREVGTG
jgi:GntR family transcriptional regulator/MocR family aminotransferase